MKAIATAQPTTGKAIEPIRRMRSPRELPSSVRPTYRRSAARHRARHALTHRLVLPNTTTAQLRPTRDASAAAPCWAASSAVLPSLHDRDPVVRSRLPSELERIMRSESRPCAASPDVRRRLKPRGIAQSRRVEHDQLRRARWSPQERIASAARARVLATPVGKFNSVVAWLAPNHLEVDPPRDDVEREIRVSLPLAVGTMARVDGDRASIEPVLDLAA